MLPVRAAAGAALALCLLVSGAPAASGMPLPASCPSGNPAGGIFAVCFDELASGTASSAADFPHVEILDALVLSETHASFLVGFDTSSWATSGDQGILNSLLPAVDLWFDGLVQGFGVDVVALPGLGGDALPVVLQAFRGGMLVHTVLSDVGLVLGDGTHRDRLGFTGVAADHVRLFAAQGPCQGSDCEIGRTTGFFADSLGFQVPEPGAGVLLSTSAFALAALRRRRQATRSPRVSRRSFRSICLLAGLAASASCAPAPAIVTPADGSYVAPPGGGAGVPVEIALGGGFGAGSSFRVTLLAGVDAPPASFLDLTAGFSVAGGTATGEIATAQLREGRNTLFASIDADGNGTAENVVSASFSWEPNLAIETAHRCDLFDPVVCLYPFPNDFFTVADPATDTGRRIAFDPESMPVNLADTAVDPTEWNRNDGFSPGQAIQLMVPGIVLRLPPAPGQPAVIATRPVPVAGSSPEWDQARSLDPDASIVILDAETGERVPHWAELNSRVTPAQGQALLIRPAVNYASGRRYLVALRNLRNGADAIIPARRAFRLYRDGIPTYVPAIEARRAHMEEIFAALESHGVARDDLYLAWDFTVISKRNMSERLLAMRDDAFANLGAAAPEFVVDQFDSPTAKRRYLVRGRVRVPLYVTNDGETGGVDAATRLHCQDELGDPRPCQGDELPVQAGDYWAEFSCTVPTTVMAADGSAVPARPVLYGHGLLGHQDEATYGHNQDNAFEHNYVICGARWIGMGEEDFGTVAAILNDFSRFPTLADRLHQAMLNFLFVGRAMIHPDGFGTHPAFQVGGVSILDNTSLYYDGNSQGAIAGGALAAFAQDYTRAVLGVPGMNYSTLLFRSVDFSTYLVLLQFNYLDRKLYPLMFGLAQMLWDRVETNGHANHLTHDTYAGTPAKKILLHVGFGDFQVSDMSAQVEARTIGAHVHRPDFDPFGFVAANPGGLPREFWQVEPYWNIPSIPASDPGPPLPGAEGATYRFDGSALVVWDFGNKQSPSANVPPSGGNPELGPCPRSEGGDPHECPRRDPRAKLQKSEFLKPDGAVLDVCGGDYCN